VSGQGQKGVYWWFQNGADQICFRHYAGVGRRLVVLSPAHWGCHVITADQFATLQIRRVIFHDIPKKIRGSEAQPTFSEIESAVQAVQANHLKRRLIRALGSKAAFDLEFKPDTFGARQKLPSSARLK